ncbi:winged helix-turn-helix domain-containing protein [Flavobacterium sp. YJ01]|uniref:winged helix-turn-helix domain-containing protein n=1 Tax=Flavobacterium sp. YJ01 TaxID=3031997 RepID=UPI0023E38462|nr:winged helix-turn-helix domain-containing protein [Flavobacterium sp. YJ01]WET03084.1 winged helix-turn-helix domain-containing protein [Flavobacterium sp. YJ01]
MQKKYKYLFGVIAVVFIAVICFAFNETDNNSFDIAKREILLRSIGHELLLQSGDSTSRVLPIKNIAKNEYEIQFEKSFTFQPDTLVNIIRRFLSQDPRASDYVVTVLNSQNSSVIYGYTIAKNKKNDAVPCRKRIQPKANYIINIKFKPLQISVFDNKYLLGSLPLFAVLAFIFFRPVQSQKHLPKNLESDLLELGRIKFDVKNRNLIINDKTIELTATESRLLHIFALSPNNTIQRNRLQKEIWEDEGVIVGRSLDMFISKLRKKLEVDPHVNIVVVRSKGYKLEITT